MTTTRKPPRIDTAAYRRLAGRFEGQLIPAGDPAYDEARSLWNAMIDRRPALIARVADGDDARRVLAYARDEGLPVAIRGAGHNVSGSALVDGGVVIDHTARRSVAVDPVSGRVAVDPGATLGAIDAATVPYALAVPIGINTTTGVAGLTLGGGIGWLMRRHGLTIDRLVEADVVLADGTQLTANATSEPDLFWGIRGGGGNLGIVTRFVFEAVSLGPTVDAGIVLFPMEEGRAILRRYRDWAVGLPDAVTTIAGLRTVPATGAFPADIRGRRVVMVAVCAADPVDPATWSSLRGFGRPLFDTIRPTPFVDHQAMFDANVPAGWRYYWKSHYLAGLTDPVIDLLVEHNLAAPTTRSFTLVFQMGGAVGRVPLDATAFGDRTPSFNVNINGVSEDPAADDLTIPWARGLFEALAPHATGGVYVNFLMDEGHDRTQAAYRHTWDRLAAIKARYDPDNVFRTNQNVAPGRSD